MPGLYPRWAGGGNLASTLAKIYPEISGGRITAVVEVQDLKTRSVGARFDVELSVDSRSALLVRAKAGTSRAGIDFVPSS